MTAKLKVGVLVVLMIASSAAFAASANTTAEIDRSSNVDVVSDSDGLIALQANTSSGIVSNEGGELSIDFAQGDAQGVNTGSTFEVGNPDDATSSYAFNVTNQDAEARDITLSYSNIDDSDGDSNIQFQVYNETGDSIGTDNVADEEGNDAVATDVVTGETIYVVLTVDTNGLDTGADLSGTLTVSV